MFAHIVQSGGISKCATVLGMERTTVSRRLKHLETVLGTQLLIRSPKQLTITPAGRQCFEHCVRLLEIVNSVGHAVSNDDEAGPRAPIVVGAPPDVVDSYLEAKLASYEKANTGTKIRRVLLSGASKENDLSLIDLLVTWESAANIGGLVRKLAAVKQSIYASPTCIETHGLPDRLDALRKLPCIVEEPMRENRIWGFTGNDGSHRVKVRCNFVAPTLLEAREAAISGFGCCQIPDYLGEPFVRYGRLVKVLTQFQTSDRLLVTTTPLSCMHRPRTTSLRIFLECSFGTVGSTSDASSGSLQHVPMGFSASL